MKKYIFILWLALINLNTFAQDTASVATAVAQTNSDNKVWYPVFKDGKMGYINNIGQVLATIALDPLPYYSLNNFTNNFVIIKSGDDVAVFKKNGDKILDYDFEDIYYDETSNLFRVTLKEEKSKDAFGGFGKPKKVGYYNMEGKAQVPATFSCGYFDCGYGFEDDLCYMTKNDKIGFIDLNGNWKIDPQFHFTLGFKNGFAPITKEKEGDYGVINTKGQVVVPFEYKSIFNFSKTGIAVAILKGSPAQYVLINTKGKVIKKLGSLQVLSTFGSQFQFPNGNYIVTDSITNKKGIIDEGGNIVCATKYKGVAYSLENNIMIANIDGQKDKADMWYQAKGGSWVLVDATTGKEICNPIQAYELGALGDGLISFKQDDKWGFLNDKGDVVIAATYEFEPSTFKDGLARIYGEKPSGISDGPPLMGYIDKTGKVIWEIQN
jgi:hypothetical protein